MHFVYVNVWTGCGLARGVLTPYAPAGSAVYGDPRSPRPPGRSRRLRPPAGRGQRRPAQDGTTTLPVSVAKIREALETTPIAVAADARRASDVPRPDSERQKIEELLATLNFKAGPVPAGGVYMAEQNRIMFPSVDNPLAAAARRVQPGRAADHPDREPRRQVSRRQGGERDLDSRARARRGGREGRSPRGRRAVLRRRSRTHGAGIQICDTPVR